MDCALPLIALTDEGFVVDDQTASLIAQVDGPIAVLCIAGLSRTGKSFILNQFLGRMRDGFEIGPTVHPCTKGLWVWGKLIPIRNQFGSFQLLLVDTEGLGSFQANETYDHQIFSLGLLLSSLFIYNSMGTIDETAISRLAIVAELSKLVRTRAKRSFSNEQAMSDARELAQFFPSFMWLVRDFSLELVSKGGETMTDNDYLELALQSTEDTDSSKRNVKQILKDYFLERECFTIVRPIFEEKKLANATRDDLRSEFLNRIDELKQKIFNKIQPKRIQSDVLTGRTFISLCNHYTKAMNEGGIVIESCWDNIVQSECESALSRATKFYKQAIEQTISENGILEIDALEAIHNEKAKQAMKLFIDSSIGDEKKKQCKHQLKTFMANYYTKMRDVLRDTSNKLCSRILTESFADLDKKMNEFDSFTQFENKINTILTNYSSKAKGSERNNVLLHTLLRHYFPKAKVLHKLMMNRTQEANILELKQMKELHQTEIERLIKDRNSQVAALSDQNEKLSSARDKYKEQCAEHSNTIQKLRSSIVTLEGELSSHKQKSSEVSEENRRMTAQIESLQSQSISSSQKLEETRRQFYELKELKTKVEEQLHSETMESDSLKVEVATLKRSLEHLQAKHADDRTLLGEANSHIQLLEQKNRDTATQIQNLEDTLTQTTELLDSVKKEKQEMSQELQASQDVVGSLKSEILDLQSQIRMIQREVTNKTTIIRSYERAMNLEKEKAAESEDRLRLSLKEKAHLLSSDRAQELERQVEQLNSTNRRILELNKTVMEENRQLKEQITKLGGTVSGSGIYSRFTPPSSEQSSPLEKSSTISVASSSTDRSSKSALDEVYNSPTPSSTSTSKKSYSVSPRSPQHGNTRKRAASSLILSSNSSKSTPETRSITPTHTRSLMPETPSSVDSIPNLKSRIREADLNLQSPNLFASPPADRSLPSPLTSNDHQNTLRPRPGSANEFGKQLTRLPSYNEFEKQLTKRLSSSESSPNLTTTNRKTPKSADLFDKERNKENVHTE